MWHTRAHTCTVHAAANNRLLSHTLRVCRGTTERLPGEKSGTRAEAALKWVWSWTEGGIDRKETVCLVQVYTSFHNLNTITHLCFSLCHARSSLLLWHIPNNLEKTEKTGGEEGHHTAADPLRSLSSKHITVRLIMTQSNTSAESGSYACR